MWESGKSWGNENRRKLTRRAALKHAAYSAIKRL
jgi:hypothetical protein